MNKIALSILITIISVGQALAGVPPEIPKEKTIQIFSPFHFDIKDNGEDVFLKGGPNLRGYKTIAEKIQEASPTANKPTVNFDTFLNLLNQSAGVNGWVRHLYHEQGVDYI